jgi:hypothetical protein
VATLGVEARGYGRDRVGQTETRLGCVECGAESNQLASGWRAYRAPAKEEEPEGEIFMFCPECAEREFGSMGWEDPR